MSCTKCGKVGHWASQCTAPPDEWVTQGRTPAASGTQAQQQQPERRAAQQPPKGCFKCGKSGHWSRDCTAPKEDWVPRDASGNAGRTDENDAPLPGADQPAKQGVKRKAVRKPRPKVNIEDLRKDFGLKHLVDVFPAQFRTVFRGHGHEASDLRRLLDMYQHWQRQVAPALQYDAFIDGLEKMGQTHVLKMELRAMRDGVMQTTAPKPAAEAQTTPAAADGADAAADEDAGRYEDDFGGGGEMDDDELVALQAEQWETAAPADMFDDLAGQGAPAPAATAAAEEDDEEIEELLAAAEAMPLTQPEDAAMAMAAPPAPVTASQADMEEELLALAEAMDDSPPDAGGMAHPPGPPHLTSTQERDDEELLALAAMSDDESAGEAGPADGDNANDATDDAAKGTATTAPQPAGAAVAVDEPAQAARSEQCTTPASGSQDSAQDMGMAKHPAATAGELGASAEDAAVGDPPPDLVADTVEPAPQGGSLVPPDVDLADVDDEELLMMALA